MNSREIVEKYENKNEYNKNDGWRERKKMQTNKMENFQRKIGVYRKCEWLGGCWVNRVSMYSFAHLVYKNSKTCINFRVHNEIVVAQFCKWTASVGEYIFVLVACKTHTKIYRSTHKYSIFIASASCFSQSNCIVALNRLFLIVCSCIWACVYAWVLE